MSLKMREQGMLARADPRSRANAQRKAHTSIQVQRRQSGIPCAMVLRLMPCSPRRRIFVTVASGLRLVKPGWADVLRWLISNGCQDHMVCRTQQAPFVLRAANCPRVQPRPATICALTPLRHRIPSCVVTTRYAPRRTGSSVNRSSDGEAEYLAGELDRQIN